MAANAGNKAIRQLRRVLLLQDGADPTDGQLLGWFVEQHDEVAFEALVRRHGPMVLGVCRRLLHNEHDAEDAFQATFLVLVRKAASIVPRETVVNWLYGVAYLTAFRARVSNAKRGERQKQLMRVAQTTSVSPDPWDDLRILLDREVSRLPEKYRAPLVLCDLEGKTRKEAGQHLGILRAVAGQHFQSHPPAQRLLFRLVDHAHAAPADLANDAEVTQLLR